VYDVGWRVKWRAEIITDVIGGLVEFGFRGLGVFDLLKGSAGKAEP